MFGSCGKLVCVYVGGGGGGCGGAGGGGGGGDAMSANDLKQISLSILCMQTT